MGKFKIFFLTSLFQLINCQEMKKESTIPSYNVQISHTDNKHIVTPIEDSLITLEGISARLPYGSSSGMWGISGKGFTEQRGTPLGADIKYYAESESAFYHLKANFPVDKVKELIQRAYSADESESSDEPMKEFINILAEPDYNQKYNFYSKSYHKMSDLIFGFAPKGMVVVWFGFGPTQIELGQYQAEKINDEYEIKRLKEKYQKIYRVAPFLFEEIAKECYLPNESPDKWIKYRRNRYHWLPKIDSQNNKFKLFLINIDYYNGEREILLRPSVENPLIKERAIPREMSFFWGTDKNEVFEGRVFFDWKKANETFKQVRGNKKLNIYIDIDNDSLNILLNDKLIEVDSIRVYKGNRHFKEFDK